MSNRHRFPTEPHQDLLTKTKVIFSEQTRRRVLGTLAAGMAASLGINAEPVNAQTISRFPNKPIRLVVGYPPGGSGDFITRVAADELSKEFGTQVLVENRPGAGGTIANETVSKAAADGYTVLNAGPFALTNALYRKLGYDGTRDFIPVTQLAVGPMIICVHNELPVRSLSELIAYAKAYPEKLNIASSGNGSTPHLAGAQFESVAGVRMITIQFKGGAPAAASTIAGDTHVMFATPPTVMNFIKAGRLRALALTTATASPAIPGIPGAAEAGLPGYESNFSFGLYVPAGTPEATVRRLHEATIKAMAKPGVRERVASQGMDVATSPSPGAFTAALRASVGSVEKAVRDSGAKIE